MSKNFIKIDIPIYIDKKKEQLRLGTLISSTLTNIPSGVIRDESNIISSTTDTKTISNLIKINGDLLSAFNTSYGNIKDIKRGQTNNGDSTILSAVKDKLNKSSVIGVTGDFFKRILGKETAKDVRLFLDKIRENYKGIEFPYDDLYTLANPGKYPDGTDWKQEKINGIPGEELWKIVRENETFVAKLPKRPTADDIKNYALSILDEKIDNSTMPESYIQVLKEIKGNISDRIDWSYKNEEKPSGLALFSWPGFTFKNEYTSSLASKFYKLAENLQSINFAKANSDKVQNGKVATLPGWKGSIKGDHFKDERDFASKILNAGHGFATGYYGGKHITKKCYLKSSKKTRKCLK